MGPVAGPDQFRDITKAIEQAKADGATMIAGAEARRSGRLLHSPDGFHEREDHNAAIPR